MSDTGWRAQAATRAGEGRLPGAGWLIGSSLWLVPVLLYPGNGAWLGFLLIGAMLLRPTWFVAAVVYAIWAIVAATLPEGREQIVATALLQGVSIVHAMLANRRFLVTVWGRLERGEQWWGRGGIPATRRRTPGAAAPAPSRRRRPRAEVPREAEALLAAAGTDRSDYLEETPAEAPLPAPRGRRRPGNPPAPTGTPVSTDAPAGPAAEARTTVDVNTASVADFRTLDGFGRTRAQDAVDARSRRGRFASVQEFADDLGLQPHELARLRDRLTCSRPRRKSFGRRVDL